MGSTLKVFDFDFVFKFQVRCEFYELNHPEIVAKRSLKKVGFQACSVVGEDQKPYKHSGRRDGPFLLLLYGFFQLLSNHPIPFPVDPPTRWAIRETEVLAIPTR